MLGRLIFGFVLGLLVGVIAAAGLVVGLKVTVFAGGAGILLAYLAAAAVGAVTGLVTGKPIWAANAKVEAGLKAFFGALLGAGALFALQHWGGSVDLGTFGLGAYGPGTAAPIGSLPVTALPIIAAALGAIFGLDNTSGPDADTQKPSTRKRVEAAPSQGRRVSSVRAAAVEDDDAEQDAPAVGKRAKP